MFYIQLMAIELNGMLIVKTYCGKIIALSEGENNQKYFSGIAVLRADFLDKKKEDINSRRMSRILSTHPVIKWIYINGKQTHTI